MSSPSAHPSFVIGAGAESCARIVEPDTNLVVWSREPDLALRLWLESQLTTLATVEHRLELRDGRPDLAPLVARLPDHPQRRRLHDDLAHLARIFLHALEGAGVTSPRLKASFGPVHDDQCRKFHVDWVKLRLITTYVGPGTEWLPNHAVDRAHVGASACCPADANRAILRLPHELRRARAGEVLLMKGEAWPANQGRGLVHRSPPIEQLAREGSAPPARLVFILTALADRV